VFRKILIANRGEIAVRLMRACHELGIRTVTVYSDVDRANLHVVHADEAYHIGPAPSSESYLNIERVLDAARKSGAEAIHPGYGFLAENAQFARACESSGIVFIGPRPESIELMGSKTAARKVVAEAGLPTVAGSNDPLPDAAAAARVADRVGYPVMLKAAAGGGGKGMRVVRFPHELESAYRSASSEAQNAFGDPSVYLEKYIERPRHIEIQLLGDTHGNLLYLGERECSLQRRHQKLLEECPSPIVTDDLRRRMGEAAVRIGRLANYVSAGTVEFLVDRNRNFYFLEMNTRLQVEHPVTEMVVGIDMVKEMIRIAAGQKLGQTQADIKLHGAAIECRIFAEDPSNNFFPSPGRITRFRTPAGPWVREDRGVYEGWSVPLDYDPLLAKLTVWGATRHDAIARAMRALSEYEIAGIETNLRFFLQLLRHPDFVAGDIDTGFIERTIASGWEPRDPPSRETELVALLASVLEARRVSRKPPTTSNGVSPWKIAGREALLNRG
jgi:acetyl-CoA carboxylase biotin carboxylase subunit